MTTSSLDGTTARIPPLSVQPTLINHTTQRVQLVTLHTVFTGLITIIVFIRFYVRIFLMRSVGWDDYTCGFAAILSWIQAGLMINATSLGYGSDAGDIRTSTLSTSAVVMIQAMTVVYPPTIGVIKVSILLLYYRIFAVSKMFRRVLVGSIIVIALGSIFFTVVDTVRLLKCGSLADIRNRPMCTRDIYPTTLSLFVFSVVTDFWILLLPMRSILNLQLKKRRKIGLLVVFSAGAITCLVSLARIIYYSVNFHSTNFLWTAGLSEELTIVEVNIGIIVACSSTLLKFYITTRAFISSAYQSFNNRSTKESKTLSLRDDGSGMGLNNVEGRRNNSEVSHDSTISLNKEFGHQVAGPIFRTDSYEVAYDQPR